MRPFPVTQTNLKPKKGTLYGPKRQLLWLMCKEQKGASKIYRENYDKINWTEPANS